MLLRIDPAASEPIYAQIASGVRAEVVAGRLRRGDRLPSARDLAEALGVNLHTVLRGYQALRDDAVLELRRGRGAVVVADAAELAGRGHALTAFVEEARAAGLSADEAVALVRERMSP